MHALPHGLYLAYHHFDFLLVDYPAFHAFIGMVALIVLVRQHLSIRRQKRIETGQKENGDSLKEMKGSLSEIKESLSQMTDKKAL